MQPLDLSCPKQVQSSSNTNLSDCENEEVDPMSPIDHSIRSSVHHHRPRSSSGNSDESDRDLSLNLSNHTNRFDRKFPDDLSNRRSSDEQLVKNAAALLRNYLPQAAAVSAAAGLPMALDGPARKRFLTKYLHKNGEHFFCTIYVLFQLFLQLSKSFC